MNKTTIYAIITGCVLFCFLTTFIGGCQYGKAHKQCPVIRVDTLIKIDTITHIIHDKYPEYIMVHDTVFQTGYIAEKIDTQAILKDYYSVHVYGRHWEDSLIVVDVQDRISQNMPISNSFSYKILRPEISINNSVDNTTTYNRYVSVGLTVPVSDIKYSELKMLFNTDKWYAGIGYMSQINSFTIHGGVTILKFKKKR